MKSKSGSFWRVTPKSEIFSGTVQIPPGAYNILRGDLETLTELEMGVSKNGKDQQRCFDRKL